MILAKEIIGILIDDEDTAGVWKHLDALSDHHTGIEKAMIARLVRHEFHDHLPTTVCFDPDAERDLWLALTHVFMAGVALGDAPKRQPDLRDTEMQK